ncbi:TIGR02302 family protein [Phaeobacter gallaeciensis]|uniref:TIGR02302 family protein n=1 Tax=Phaeobacter gallaeciensis TaxID=60890 RepID=A0A366WNN6_9RHOB|nr:MULTISPECIES: TIGR02302 family protein [Roseobacteraceae]MBT8167371.1 TIGR02302 family protein [Falsiruegeria litorea]RBW50943.1 TIGR02302 family protein [Phaeobacter gallaeciensis]
MTAKPPVPSQIPRLSFWLTGAGIVAEWVLRSFWPFFSVVMLVLAALMLGLQDLIAVEFVWGLAGFSALAGLATLAFGARNMRFPTRTDVLIRLDASLPGRPIQALIDTQTLGAQDAASVALWQAHQARMAQRVAEASPVEPDLKLSTRDPYAVRYMALLAFVVAVVFGSISRVETVAGLAPGAGAGAGGATWEGWIEPPRYTGLPTLYLNDQALETLTLPVNSRISLRFYGEVGALTLNETISGQVIPDPSAPEQSLVVTKAGSLSIAGPNGQSWLVQILQDKPPQISVSGLAETRAEGRMALPFTAQDDYGISGGQVTVELDLLAVDRRHGLSVDPDSRAALVLDLPIPITGDRSDFVETLIEDFSQHPWAHLPVRITLTANDAAGQTGEAAPFGTALPARSFFDPLAAAIVEQRRDLLWARANAARVAQFMRAISHRPEDLFHSSTGYLRYRIILRRLEVYTQAGLTPEWQTEIAAALWDLAILLEDGNLGDALERLRRAQERLSEAMKNGATDEEIAELMQDLREATEDYLRQLSRQAQQEGGDQPQGQSGESMQMTQDDLQKMMDKIQELMEQGRMAEAQQALDELQQMMENMRVTQGQQGQSEGQRAMEGLADTLRNQQGLSDQAFRDLQEQFNPGAQAGESQENQGRDGGQGRGQSHSGQGGTGAGDGEDGQQGAGSLADRQQALREELRRQQENMPGAGTPEGDATRESLDRAGRAMEGAEQALRENDMAEALDQQSSAMEALREGMRSLGEAMAQEQQNQPGQGTQEGDAQAQNRDPLGRQPGSQGSIGTDENLLQGQDVYRRARELLDEIRRRSGEGERPEIELDYLKRLLDRF